jgi:uncharacterized delta-60 repeat protein
MTRNFRTVWTGSSAVATLSFALALLTALLAPALAQATKPGDLNRSFGDQGWVRTRIAAHDHAHSVVIDSKGHIVAAGSAANGGLFGLARYRPSGRLDHSFSGDGRVTARLAGGTGWLTNSASSVAIDSRGRIVAAGSKCNWTDPPAEGGEVIGCEFALVRYLPNGSPDSSFDGDGQLTTELGGSYANSVAIDSQDRIVAAGGSTIARYRRNGTLDPSFGDGGAIENLPGFVRAVAIDSQGRIVALGGQESGYSRFFVARFLPNGTPDSSFGSGVGWEVTRRGGAEAVAIDAEDRILAAGGSPPQHGTPGGFALDLYKPDGTPARTFGGDGRVTTHFRGPVSALARSVAIDSRGRIVAVGGIGSHDFALARYRRDGSLDRSFSGNGKASGPFAFPHRRHAGLVLAGAIDFRDRIVVAGGESHFLLARFIGRGH